MMRNLFFNALFMLFMLSYVPLVAEQDNTRHFSIGIGPAYQSMLDQGLSPLLYDGFQFAFMLGFERHRPQLSHIASFQALMGGLSSARQEVMGNHISNSCLDIRYSFRYKLWQNPDGRLKALAGPGLSSLQLYRVHDGFSNSAYSNYFLNTISLQGFLNFDFLLFGRRFGLMGGLDVPLLSFAFRQAYTIPVMDGMLRGKEGLDALLSSGKVYVPGSFWGLGSQWHFQYHLKNGNAIALEYHSHFHSLDDVNPVKDARHQLFFKAMFNF